MPHITVMQTTPVKFQTQICPIFDIVRFHLRNRKGLHNAPWTSGNVSGSKTAVKYVHLKFCLKRLTSSKREITWNVVSLCRRFGSDGTTGFSAPYWIDRRDSRRHHNHHNTQRALAGTTFLLIKGQIQGSTCVVPIIYDEFQPCNLLKCTVFSTPSNQKNFWSWGALIFSM